VVLRDIKDIAAAADSLDETSIGFGSSYFKRRDERQRLENILSMNGRGDTTNIKCHVCKRTMCECPTE
jgi:hypothetical protein